MAVYNRAVSAGVQGQQYGIRPEVINWNAPLVLGSYKVSASNVVYTRASAWSAATLNSTVAPGTAIDFPRNLVYLLTPNTASTELYSGGTIVALGRLDNGSTTSESVALSAIAAVSDPKQGTICFAHLATISFQSISIHTASSSASTDFSFHVGVGNKVGLPWSVKGSSAVPFAWIGTSIQLTTSATGSSSSNAYSVCTGPIGSAAISFSNALATGTPVACRAILNR